MNVFQILKKIHFFCDKFFFDSIVLLEAIKNPNERRLI